MIARNEQKLTKRKQEIKLTSSAISVKTIVADFANSNDPSIIKSIAEQTKDLDLSLLVNNVGIDGDIWKAPHKHHVNLVTVNCTTPTLMAKMFLERAMKRSKRSGVIEVSSMASIAAMPDLGAYGATKAFNVHLTMPLQWKTKEKVDYLLLRPGRVAKAMLDNPKIDRVTCTTDQCVESTLRVLGHRAMTFGHYKHVLQGSLAQAAIWLFSYDFLAFCVKTISKKKKKGRKKKAVKKEGGEKKKEPESIDEVVNELVDLDGDQEKKDEREELIAEREELIAEGEELKAESERIKAEGEELMAEGEKLKAE